ncbi:hypothetical protein [Treponema sp.]|uniref:hypothetical protein n=1 Tax=Treponema sp. TaxID=166 RepID=UPI00388FB8C2
MKSSIKCLKSLFIITIGSIILSESIYARSRQEVIPAGHWIFDGLSRIVMDSGRTDFVFYGPMTLSEIERHLSKVDYERLSDDAAVRFDQIKEYIEYETPASFGSDMLKIQAELEANLEGYYKNEEAVERVYDRYHQKPLMYIPLKITLEDYFAMSMDLRVAQTQGYKIKHKNYSNVPLAADAFDLNFPHDYYFATGHDFTDSTGLSFIFGTMASNFNRSLSGSVAQSEYFTGATYADLSVWSGNFRYKMNVSQFNPDRYMYTHEIGMLLGSKLQFTARESLFVYAPMELRYLAPWNIFHGFAAWKDYETRREGGESNTCDYMCLKLDYAPVRNTRLYGIFAMDQFQMPTEADDPDDCTPRGFGFQAGTEVFIPFGEGAFHIWLEGTYTDPYMYIKASPNWSLVRYYQDLMGPMQDDFYTEWYGTPWGPDTVGGEISIGYENAGKWSVTLDYLFKACGEYSGDKVFRGLDWNWKDRDKSKAAEADSKYKDWAYPSKDYDGTPGADDAKDKQNYRTPHGTTEYVNRIALRGTMTPAKGLSFMVQPAFTYVINSGNTEGETKKGVEIAVSVSKKFF